MTNKKSGIQIDRIHKLAEFLSKRINEGANVSVNVEVLNTSEFEYKSDDMHLKGNLGGSYIVITAKVDADKTIDMVVNELREKANGKEKDED